MDDWPKLNQGLVLYPPVRVIEAPFEKVEAILQLLVLMALQTFNELRQLLDAHLARAPNLILVELFVRAVHLIDKNFIVEVLRDGDQSWQEELLDLEEHAILDLFEMLT